MKIAKSFASTGVPLALRRISRPSARGGRRWAALVLSVFSTAHCSGAASPQSRAPAIADVALSANFTPLAQMVVPGAVTVIWFWAPWCSACHALEPAVRATLARNPNVKLRRIELSDPDAANVRGYELTMLPFVRIFDARGHLRYVLAGPDVQAAGELAVKLARQRE